MPRVYSPRTIGIKLLSEIGRPDGSSSFVRIAKVTGGDCSEAASGVGGGVMATCGSESINPEAFGAGKPSRTVYCADALAWLDQHAPLTNTSLITSLPDVSAFPRFSLADWKCWFIDVAGRLMTATCESGVSIFYQTDIKRDGVWVDKGYLCQRAAEAAGVCLLWHKVVCRKQPGEPVYGRPGYTHLLCFSKRVKDHPTAYPDVLGSTGLMTWSQAMGVAACQLACRYVLSHTATRTVVDPFCGVGTVLAVANALGLDAIGIEIANKRARKARTLSVSDVF